MAVMSVEDRAWRWARRTMGWQEADRPWAEGTMGVAGARLTVALADLRRAVMADLPRPIRRLIRWVMP